MIAGLTDLLGCAGIDTMFGRAVPPKLPIQKRWGDLYALALRGMTP